MHQVVSRSVTDGMELRLSVRNRATNPGESNGVGDAN